jgi:diaminopimelate decarboxylase
MTLLDMLPSLGKAAARRFDAAIWPMTSYSDYSDYSDGEGRRCLGDAPLTDIADEFGTPAYVIDENDFRHRARHYRKRLRDVEVVYAGKSLLSTAVARWAREEGLGIDVYSPKELAVALAGGMNPARIVMHGNPTSPQELRNAVAVGVGRIVVDSDIEIAYLAGLKRRQRVLVRVTPDVDSHGHRAVTTGISDQKFGFTLGGGQAADAVERVLAHPNLDLIGLHCHIGSQVTEPALYGETIHRMIAAMADVRARHGVILTELNIGGGGDRERGEAGRSGSPPISAGHGVPYVRGDAELGLDKLATVIEDALDEACAAEHFPRPAVVVELAIRPGDADRLRGASGRSTSG